MKYVHVPFRDRMVDDLSKDMQLIGSTGGNDADFEGRI